MSDMGNFSTAVATALLNAMLRDTPYMGPATVYLALYTTDPTDDDVGIEVDTLSGEAPTGYERIAVTFTDPAAGSGRECENDEEVEFPECLIAWGTITHCGIRTHAEPGEGDTLLAHAELATAKEIDVEDVLRFKPGRLVVSLAATPA